MEKIRIGEMSVFSEALESGKFAVTSEVGPPKGVDIENMMQDAELFKGSVDAVNVTDQQSSVMRLGSLAVSHLLLDQGIEPIFQMTCRDRNRIEPGRRCSRAAPVFESV